MKRPWPTLALGELTATTRPIQYGVLKPGPFVVDGVPMLRVVDLAGDRISMRSVHRISAALDSEFKRTRLRGGEILLSIQGTVGRVALVPRALAGANISRTLAILEPDSRLLPEFLRYFLLATTAQGTYKITGTTRASLNIADIRAMQAPVPPLDEQQRIVAVLEDHLSRLDAGRQYLAAGAHRTEGLRQAVIDRTLGMPGTEHQPLHELLAGPLVNGRSVPDGEGAQVLRLGALRGEVVDVHVTKAGAWSEAEAAPFRIRRGDLLMGRGNGSRHLVGRAALVRDEPPTVAFPDTMIRVRPDSRKIDPVLLRIVWNSSYVRRQIEAAALTTAGILKINQRQIASVSVPVPPRERQFAALADLLYSDESSSKRLQQDASRAEGSGKALRRSLLEAAFSGRL